MIIKVIPQAGQPVGLSKFQLLTDSWSPGLTIPGSGEPEFWNDNLSGHIEVWPEDGPNSVLVLHTDSGYPSADNPSYYDVYPNSNPDTVVDLTVHLSEFGSLVYQPHAYMRGGLVAGSDSLRHNLSIVNEGSGICLALGLDVIIKAHEAYVHKAGSFSFTGPDACMQFRSGSRLHVVENAHLIYGSSPSGILQLYNDMDLRIEKYAKLEIGNKLILNNDGTRAHDRIDLELGPYSALTFRKGASIRNWSQGAITKLHIYLQGGLLDVSQLDDESLSHVVIHYPESSDGATIDILGAVSEDYLEYGWTANEESTTIVRIYTRAGRLVDEYSLSALPGKNYDRRGVQGLSSGLYLISLVQGNQQLTGRFIKD